MKPSDYKKLEADKRFKRYYMGKTLWWKDFLILAPALIIFIGLAGIMQLGYDDNLFSWYAAPYIAAFVLGSIWLKGVKNHLQTKILGKTNIYLACAARSIGEHEGRYYFIFSKDNKRHNEGLINSLVNELSIDTIPSEKLKLGKSKMIEIETSETETPVYLRAFAKNNVMRTNKMNIGTGITPILYISEKEMFVIRYKDLP